MLIGSPPDVLAIAEKFLVQSALPSHSQQRSYLRSLRTTTLARADHGVVGAQIFHSCGSSENDEAVASPWTKPHAETGNLAEVVS